jgi:lysophospholipase L1-like esterase
VALAQVSVTPAHRLGEAWWAERHKAAVAATQRGGIEVAFLGDSITQGWEGAGKAAWDRTFAPLGAANFGFSGDRTEHVLWRLENGELVGAKPKVVVVMIGTNNLGHGSSDAGQTAQGVRAVCDCLLRASPKTKVLLLAILPRALTADDRLRTATIEASSGFARRADGRAVFFEDTGGAFVRPDGTLKTVLMPDLLHLSPEGYEVWAKAIERPLRRILASPG